MMNVVVNFYSRRAAGERKGYRKPLTIVLFLLFSGIAHSQDTPGVSLEIRGPTNAIRQGDEIPIEFILHNNSKSNCTLADFTSPINIRSKGFRLTASNASGERLPDPCAKIATWENHGSPVVTLRPGETFSTTIPLNQWAPITAPGDYRIAGTGPYLAQIPWCEAPPITITVLPRTRQEMHQNVQAVTQQIEKELAQLAGQPVPPGNLNLGPLVLKLSYTGEPEIVPTILRVLYEAGTDTGENGDPLITSTVGTCVHAGLVYFVPHSAETKQAILQAAVRQGLNWTIYNLLTDWDFKPAELKTLVERALGVRNPSEWAIGARLAGRSCYDDSFTPRLVALATTPEVPRNTRIWAFQALAINRTDAGVKALKKLVHDPEPEMAAGLVIAISSGYGTNFTGATGRHLKPGDLSLNDVQPLMTLLRNSSNRVPASLLQNLTETMARQR